MVGFCIHCGASTPNEFVVVNGNILPSSYVRCSYCGKMAGIKDKIEEEDRAMELIEKADGVIIKDGKVTPA
ncbi:MAG: hypothetical protein AAB038_02735 [Planctomycetota bacterium]